MMDSKATPQADIGVFGGSGFYTFTDDDSLPGDLRLEATDTFTMDSEWGEPSSPVTIVRIRLHNGALARVAFLARHGLKHQHPPHRVNYRANVDVMRQLGVKALVSPFAAGSLEPHIQPEDFLVPDQIIDRTYGRGDTFHDHFPDGPNHMSFADPYDSQLRKTVLDAAQTSGVSVHPSGTVMVINGPRFATRAESQWHRNAGCQVVNMTQAPEAPLAREANIPYCGIALVTDYDAGLKELPDVEPVTQEKVMEVIDNNVSRVRELLFRAIPKFMAD